MTGTEHIKREKIKWIILVTKGGKERVLCHHTGKPLITDDVIEAKALALRYSGRRVDLTEFLKDHEQ